MHTRGKATSSRNRYFTALFLVLGLYLVALCSVEAAPATETLRKNQRDRDLLFKNMKAATTEYTFDYVVIWLKPGSLPGVNVPVPVSHVRFSSTVFFKFDKSDIEPVAETVIQAMADTLLQDKSMRSLLIVGHTDSIGTDEYNQALSHRRAIAVATKLRERNVKEEYLGLVPMGEAQPATSNSTPRGRSLNRRVEFFISDVPGAPRKAAEEMSYNPCHKNDHEGLRVETDCATGSVRIPVFPASGQGRPIADIDLTREPLPTPPVPVTRERIPNEIFQRPSLKELHTPE